MELVKVKKKETLEDSENCENDENLFFASFYMVTWDVVSDGERWRWQRRQIECLNFLTKWRRLLCKFSLLLCISWKHSEAHYLSLHSSTPPRTSVLRWYSFYEIRVLIFYSTFFFVFLVREGNLCKFKDFSKKTKEEEWKEKKVEKFPQFSP